jgi:hypothetical protein
LSVKHVRLGERHPIPRGDIPALTARIMERRRAQLPFYPPQFDLHAVHGVGAVPHHHDVGIVAHGKCASKLKTDMESYLWRA